MLQGLNHKDKFQLTDLWINAYYSNLGEFDNKPETFNLLYITFFISTVINIVVILNLLISILGDSFDKFQVSASEIDLREMTSVLYEIESLLFWRLKSTDEGMYLYACDSLYAIKDDWKGKVQIIIEEMANMQKNIINKIEDRDFEKRKEKEMRKTQENYSKIFEGKDTIKHQESDLTGLDRSDWKKINEIDFVGIVGKKSNEIEESNTKDIEDRDIIGCKDSDLKGIKDIHSKDIQDSYPDESLDSDSKKIEIIDFIDIENLNNEFRLIGENEEAANVKLDERDNRILEEIKQMELRIMIEIRKLL